MDASYQFQKGFPEFSIRAGYWRVGEEVAKINRDEILVDFDRKVVLEDRKPCTILTYKGNKKKRVYTEKKNFTLNINLTYN